MDTLPKYLPKNLIGQTAGVFLEGENVFLDDVDKLNGRKLPVDGLKHQDDYAEFDYFVLDMRSHLGIGYAAALRKVLDEFERVSDGRPMYAAIPYVELDYQWDIYNFTIPASQTDAFPGARHIYDNMMSDFAVRSIGSLPMEDKMRCMLMRLSPLSRTVICVMAASGQGKTTFVRQLKQKSGTYHVSSDYLLNSILALKDGKEYSEHVKNIRSKIGDLEPQQIWSTFFRSVEQDDNLLYSFLEIALQQLEVSGDKLLVSFDIDAREPGTHKKVKNFFQEKGLKTWICMT